MKYLLLQTDPSVDAWLDTVGTARRIVDEQRRSGEPPAVVWAEAYAELAAACCFRFHDQQRADPSGFAARVDSAICGAVRFAATVHGLSLPNDWLQTDGGEDRLRASVWGSAAAMRTAQLEETSVAFEHMSLEEKTAMLERLADKCRVIGRRAAFEVIDRGKS